MSKYEQNSKVSSRPWNLSHDIDNDTMDIIDNNGFTVIEDFQFSSSLSDEDAEHIIYCVNEHDSLVAEVERLKQENEQLKRQSFTGIELANVAISIDRTKRENEQLREALKKCSPWLITTEQCLICGGKYNHTDDCEYVRLCGGEE